MKALLLVHGVGFFDAKTTVADVRKGLAERGVSDLAVACLDWNRLVRSPRPTAASPQHSPLPSLLDSGFIGEAGVALVRAANAGFGRGAGAYRRESPRLLDLQSVLAFVLLGLTMSPLILYAAGIFVRGVHCALAFVLGATVLALVGLFACGLMTGRRDILAASIRRGLLLAFWPIIHLGWYVPDTLALLLVPTLATFTLGSFAMGLAPPDSWTGQIAMLVVMILVVGVTALTIAMVAAPSSFVLKFVADVVRYVGLPHYRRSLLKALDAEVRAVLAAQPERVIIAAHSLGTVLALDYLVGHTRSFAATEVWFVTMGSPIRRFFSRFFPRLFLDPSLSAAHLQAHLRGFRWINVFRRLDYVGTKLRIRGVPDLPVHRALRFHVNYWGDRRVVDTIVEALKAPPSVSSPMLDQPQDAPAAASLRSWRLDSCGTRWPPYVPWRPVWRKWLLGALLGTALAVSVFGIGVMATRAFLISNLPRSDGRLNYVRYSSQMPGAYGDPLAYRTQEWDGAPWDVGAAILMIVSLVLFRRFWVPLLQRFVGSLWLLPLVPLRSRATVNQSAKPTGELAQSFFGLVGMGLSIGLLHFGGRQSAWRKEVSAPLPSNLGSAGVGLSMSRGVIASTDSSHAEILDLTTGASRSQRLAECNQSDCTWPERSALSPDGGFLAVFRRHSCGTCDKGLVVWDMQAGRPLWSLPLEEEPLRVSVSRTGTRLALSREAAIHIRDRSGESWDIRVPQRTWTLAALSNDGTCIVATGARELLWSCEPFEEVRRVPADTGLTRGLAIAPDRSAFAVAEEVTNRIRILDSANGAVVAEQAMPTVPVAVSFAEDRRYLAVGLLEGGVVVWNWTEVVSPYWRCRLCLAPAFLSAAQTHGAVRR